MVEEKEEGAVEEEETVEEGIRKSRWKRKKRRSRR